MMSTTRTSTTTTTTTDQFTRSLPQGTKQVPGNLKHVSSKKRSFHIINKGNGGRKDVGSGKALGVVPIAKPVHSGKAVVVTTPAPPAKPTHPPCSRPSVAPIVSLVVPKVSGVTLIIAVTFLFKLCLMLVSNFN